MFVEEPSKKLCCMLCNHVFKDPVITSCGVCLFLHGMTLVFHEVHVCVVAYLLSILCSDQAEWCVRLEISHVTIVHCLYFICIDKCPIDDYPLSVVVSNIAVSDCTCCLLDVDTVLAIKQQHAVSSPFHAYKKLLDEHLEPVARIKEVVMK